MERHLRLVALALVVSARAFAELTSFTPQVGVLYPSYYNPFDVVVYDANLQPHPADWRASPTAVALVNLGPDGWYKQCIGVPGSCPTCEPYCAAGRAEFAKHGIGNPTTTTTTAAAPAPTPEPQAIAVAPDPTPAAAPMATTAEEAFVAALLAYRSGKYSESTGVEPTPSALAGTAIDPYAPLYEALIRSFYESSALTNDP